VHGRVSKGIPFETIAQLNRDVLGAWAKNGH
jgi:hypothetical protein